MKRSCEIAVYLLYRCASDEKIGGLAGFLSSREPSAVWRDGGPRVTHNYPPPIAARLPRST